MKKLVAVVLFGVSLAFSNLAVVHAEPPGQVFIASFKYAASGDNFIEIGNNLATDLTVDSLELIFYNTSYSPRPTRVALGAGTILAGQSILIKERLSSSAVFDGEYDKSLTSASAGAVRLVVDGVVTSALCWGAVASCETNFSAKSLNASSGLVDNYWINTTPTGDRVEVYVAQPAPVSVESGGFVPVVVDPPPDPEPPAPLADQYCAALRLNEISTNDQWIEVYNASALTVRAGNLANCVLAVQYGDKEPLNYSRYRTALSGLLGDGAIGPYGYLLVDVSVADGLSLPKSVKDRSILIHDSGSDYSEIKYSTLKTGTSWAYFADGWKATYQPTPGSENVYQQWQTCEAGKHINEKTGNCVKDPDPPAECAEGQYRNPATGRCKKYDTEKTLAECPEGQFRNPATNRCKKIASDDDLKPCAEGWERNPETNRCRKIQSKEPAKFALDQLAASRETGLWMWASVGGLTTASGMTTWQFRQEITRWWRKFVKIFTKGKI